MKSVREAVRLNLLAWAAIIAFVLLAMTFKSWPANAANWDRDAAQTEETKIRNSCLSKAGTPPTYKMDPDTHQSLPTGETYHGNCCGFADAYEADETFIDEEGNLFAVLTCNDPANCVEILGKEVCGSDEESGNTVCSMTGAKVTRAPGSKWRVPPDKVLLPYEPVNNTGHGWVYISASATGPDGKAVTLCWAAPPGM